jgi:hypothetical protein
MSAQVPGSCWFWPGWDTACEAVQTLQLYGRVSSHGSAAAIGQVGSKATTDRSARFTTSDITSTYQIKGSPGQGRTNTPC